MEAVSPGDAANNAKTQDQVASEMPIDWSVSVVRCINVSLTSAVVEVDEGLTPVTGA